MIFVMRVLLASRKNGRRQKYDLVGDEGHGESDGAWWWCIVTCEKPPSEQTIDILHSATVIDRWVDNEERVGDFLWAANEPSGGTFQVKMNLLVKFVSKNI